MAEKDLIPVDKKEIAKVIRSDNRYNTLPSMIEDAKLLIKSKLVPYKNPADVILVMQAATDLKIPIPFALANFYSVNKKLSASIQIKNALIRRAGIKIDILENYEIVSHFRIEGGYEVILNSAEYKAANLAAVTPAQWNAMTEPQREAFLETSKSEGKAFAYRLDDPYIDIKGMKDRRTTIRITRKMKDVNGDIVENVITDSYHLHEAFKAGYFQVGKEKENWLLHTKMMMVWRAAGRVIDEAAPDIVFNLGNLEEVAHEEGFPFSISEEGIPSINLDEFEDAETEEDNNDPDVEEPSPEDE